MRRHVVSAAQYQTQVLQTKFFGRTWHHGTFHLRRTKKRRQVGSIAGKLFPLLTPGYSFGDHQRYIRLIILHHMTDIKDTASTLVFGRSLPM